MQHSGAHLNDRRDLRSGRRPHEVDHLKRPRVPVDGDLVTLFDRHRHECHGEVVAREILDADGNPGPHAVSMKQDAARPEAASTAQRCLRHFSFTWLCLRLDVDDDRLDDAV